MPSKARQKKFMEKLNRAQKYSILGPQNLVKGGRVPGAPWIRACKYEEYKNCFMHIFVLMTHSKADIIKITVNQDT